MIDRAEQKRRIRHSTWLFGLIALGFYFGFIALSVVRSRHG